MKYEVKKINRLMSLLATSHNLQEIVDCASAILNNPILLTDATMNLLAVCKEREIEDEIWNDFLEGKSHSKQYKEEKTLIQLMQNVMYGNRAILTELKDHKYRRVVHKVSCENNILGYIVCLEYTSTFSDTILDEIQLVCDAFAIELQKEHTFHEKEKSTHEFILNEILTNKRNIDSYTSAFLHTLFGMENHYYVVCVPFSNAFSTKQQDYLRSYLEQLSSFIYTTIIEDHIVILINTSKEKFSFLITRISSSLELHNLCAGCSECFSSIYDLKKYYIQAKNTANTATLISNKTMNHHEDLVVYNLLHALSKQEDLKQYSSSALTLLNSYDLKYGTNYLTTLKYYLKYCGNISLIAEKMDVHRNTIIHRIERIEEITNLSLEQEETRIKLSLSFKIQKVIKNKAVL